MENNNWKEALTEVEEAQKKKEREDLGEDRYITKKEKKEFNLGFYLSKIGRGLVTFITYFLASIGLSSLINSILQAANSGQGLKFLEILKNSINF